MRFKILVTSPVSVLRINLTKRYSGRTLSAPEFEKDKLFWRRNWYANFWFGKAPQKTWPRPFSFIVCPSRNCQKSIRRACPPLNLIPMIYRLESSYFPEDTNKK